MATTDNSTTPTCSPPARKSWLGSLSNVLVITAIIGTFLTLLGFGAALSLETFGLSPAVVYSSPFDFLVLSSEVLLVLFDVLNKAYKNPEIHHFWYFFVAIVISAVLLVLYVLTRNDVQKFLLRVVKKRVHPLLRSLQRRAIFRWFSSWIKLPLFTLAAWVASASLLRGFLLLLLAIVFFLMLPSLMGYLAGKSSIDKYVINPSDCASLHSRKNRMRPPENSHVNPGEQAPTAICLRVLKDGKELGRGRKIERNQDTVFLFKPDTGEVLSIPTKDAIVEQVNEL